VSPDLPIARAIEEVVIEEIYDRIARMKHFDGRAPAPWMIQCVVEQFASKRKESEITPGYVSGLLWMLIDDGKIEIDKYGMVTVVPALV
jgi:hypothetical protein